MSRFFVQWRGNAEAREGKCLRTIDRLRLGKEISFEESATRREALYNFLDAIDLVDLTPGRKIGALLRWLCLPGRLP